MAASVSADAHGVRVVTHIIPLERSEPDQYPSKTKEVKDEPEVPYMTRMFLKGEPVALGTVQIFVGIVMMVLGAITLLTKTLDGEVPLGLGLAFAFCGSVTLGAHKGTCPPLIKGTMALNIIVILLGLSGVGYFSYVFTVRPDLGECAKDLNDYRSYYYYSDCSSISWRLQNLIIGLKVVLLVLSVLEVCVCTTLVVFSCKANCRASVPKPVVVMVQGAEQADSGSREALLNAEVCPPALEV
ncbi:membrane-spanning 4-domains subfamily A member 4D [Trichomycterus rosablanca]|uniref:membrane-spanning 4-domains subfamily A member 4D n=1 Tax=Trichomycterus rosablanca TaxID=2290929 RepID=UPI002F360F69